MRITELLARLGRSQVHVPEPTDLALEDCMVFLYFFANQLSHTPPAYTVANWRSLPFTKSPLKPQSSQVAPSSKSTPSS